MFFHMVFIVGPAYLGGWGALSSPVPAIRSIANWSHSPVVVVLVVLVVLLVPLVLLPHNLQSDQLPTGHTHPLPLLPHISIFDHTPFLLIFSFRVSAFVLVRGLPSETKHYSNDTISRDHIIQYTPCSLGSVLGNIALGTVFLDTIPRMNIRPTSSHRKHWQCSSK